MAAERKDCTHFHQALNGTALHALPRGQSLRSGLSPCQLPGPSPRTLQDFSHSTVRCVHILVLP
eukprot:3620297-Amphidinium_carterae.3